MKKNIISRLFVAYLVLLGGAVLPNDAIVFGQDAKSQNTFAASPVLPKDLKRVVVLPLARDESHVDLSSGCETLDTILQAELVKTKKFEVLAASPEMLRTLTGRLAWTGAEILPSNFFDSLRRAYGCDAVLFCQLTTFRAYAPLAVGWRMKLVDARTQKIIWAADEIFDAGEPAVAKDAEQFQKQEQNVEGKTTSLFRSLLKYADREPQSALDDQWDIMNSPRYFGRYSVVKLLQTLPAR